MRRRLGWALGAAGALVLLTAPAEAQVRVDIGVGTPNVGARVVIGDRPVYVVERVPVRRERVYVDRRGGPPPWAPAWGHRRQGRDRAYEREYYRDLREAEREYARDLREARRDYERERREAERDRRRW